jgi:hypothetical protein
MLRDVIDVLITDGASLAEIERDVIETSELEEDSRDALWLYAWGCLERQRPPAAVVH